MRRYLAGILCMVMCFGMGVLPAAADTFFKWDAVGVAESAVDEPAEGDAAEAGIQTSITPGSPPYSRIDSGTFWSMTPGETDDAVIWDILMQPITVYDGGLASDDHAYLMENPDGSGKKVAQIHGQSQGLHVIGEPNEHGYVLAEVFSSYDNKNFVVTTDEERASAFDLKQGYVKAAHLKTMEVRQDMALLIDKLTQRMYLFIDGKRVTEFLISTGKITGDDKYHYDTTTGEFITVTHVGGFEFSKYMYCDMAIRINGGILLHEVPHEVLADKTKKYTQYENELGTMASHGCVRIQRKETPEGYNHRWLWDNLERGAPYKVLVWSEYDRTDTPMTWQ